MKWQYVTILQHRYCQKPAQDLLKIKKATFLSESTPLKLWDAVSIFFGGLKIDPAKAAACVASVAVEGEKRGAAQWLGVDSQLIS
jgi:hypothetical protein